MTTTPCLPLTPGITTDPSASVGGGIGRRRIVPSSALGHSTRPRRDRTVTAIGVMFAPGARTYWHSHPDGQVLYVASGAGRVGSADGAITEMAAGDVIYTPAGESHWHGATPTSYMMHISITTGGATVWEPRAVTEEEYHVPVPFGSEI